MIRSGSVTYTILLALSGLLLTSCAAKPSNVTTRYSLDGPPLAIAAEQGDLLFEGSMDREAMLGDGHMEFKRVNRSAQFGEIGVSADSPLPEGADSQSLHSDDSSEDALLEPVESLPAQIQEMSMQAEAGGRVMDSDTAQLCAGPIRARINQQGHLAAALLCDNNDLLMLTYRALGPDQGIGIGRFVRPSEDKAIGEPLIFYFHPWQEEARRRLDQEKDALRGIISKGQAQ